MTAERAGRVQWRQTTVVIRADILARATEQGIDISSACNRTLADQLGIDYREQTIPELAHVKPVIIASEPVKLPHHQDTAQRRKTIRPVLNAEDPATPVNLIRTWTEPTPPQEREPSRPAPEPGHGGQERPRGLPPAPEKESRSQSKGSKKPRSKKSRDDVIRTFLTKKVRRTEQEDGGLNQVPKEEMYQIFIRWCRSHNYSPVPDSRAFSVALKNQFVMEECVNEGTPYWINVTLR